MKRLAVLILALALAACSDDTQAPTPDKGGQVDKGTVADKSTTLDKGVIADKGITVDKGTVVDTGIAVPTILTSSHKGWKKTGCATCHTLPVKGHTTSATGECAKCHGGNGACNPNGPNSGKKDHSSTMGCTSCHNQKHGFTTATECQNCHYAPKGTSDCP